MGKIFYKGVDYSSPTSSGVSGVKGNKETVYRVGNVNITPENVGALAENGDSKDNTVTFESNDTSTSDAWTDVTVLATGEKHSSLFAKISTMFKNIRYIYTHFIKSENILETLEEIAANTQSGKVAGALAVKELNSNFTNLIDVFFSSAQLIYYSFDYNNFTTNGLYYLNGSEPAKCTNGPEPCTNCYVIVFGESGRKHQIILAGNNTYAWYRSMVTDTTNWYGWKQIGNIIMYPE